MATMTDVDSTYYRLWLARVSFAMEQQHGITVADVADYWWRRLFDSGFTAADALAQWNRTNHHDR